MMYDSPKVMYALGEAVKQRMHRTQIYLEPDLSAALDRLARQRGTSRASLIREATRKLLAREAITEENSILGLIGMGQDTAGDVSERHDHYLAEHTLKQMC
jgi:metal-responsive CopG/Arc/MetJ family transcriptional regulator